MRITFEIYNIYLSNLHSFEPQDLQQWEARFSFEEIERFARNARRLARISRLRRGREEALERLEAFRTGLHLVSASMILSDFELHEKRYDSPEAVSGEEAEAYRHLREARGIENKDDFAAALKQGAERTRNRVAAERICEQLATCRKPLTWAEYLVEQERFEKYRDAADLAEELDEALRSKFKRGADKLHDYSAEYFLDVLFSGEGQTMFHEDIDEMAADITKHFNAIEPTEVQKHHDRIWPAIARAKSGNGARRKAVVRKRGAAAPEPGGGGQG